MSIQATNVKAIRKAVNLTQVQLARALGVAQSLISACETGKTSPAELLVKLGNFAARNDLYAEAVWFWQKAGVAIEGIIPAALDMLKETKLGARIGETTYIPYGLLSPDGVAEKPRIVWDSRLLQNSYFAKYVIAGQSLLVLDGQETDLWKLIGSNVAVLQQPASADRVDAVRRELADYGLSKYPILEPGKSDISSLHSGQLNTSRTEDATVVTLETRTAIGLTVTQIVAVEVEARRGIHAKVRIQIPYFTVLGRVVAWVDMRGKSLPADVGEKHVSHGKKEKRRKQATKRTAKKNATRKGGK